MRTSGPTPDVQHALSSPWQTQPRHLCREPLAPFTRNRTGEKHSRRARAVVSQPLSAIWGLGQETPRPTGSKNETGLLSIIRDTSFHRGSECRLRPRPCSLQRHLNFAAYMLPVSAFDLIDAHYVYPDGVAAVALGRAFRKPVVLTARGSDITQYPEYGGPAPNDPMGDAASRCLDLGQFWTERCDDRSRCAG